MYMNFVCSFKDTWKYYATRCGAGWYPHNRNCYRLHKEEKSWDDASLSCQRENSRLISISSMADEELLLNLLESGEFGEFKCAGVLEVFCGALLCIL